ncbi:hypothetical protein GCM10017083_00640 [Thalassobaculum fulvum]|uniref:Lysozyme inhibitor LprI N-terminal domain-containing protein n=1 Tax=Thalassobaculum fulvum TaxID=1633335 RepID=A0A918XN44_9PROT|nr:hypothetical protein [Thalassobaculum fulvum]GHD39131.1 hypothetical protein GCM10017083_00640 [Thalassobaculum fulvum]
MRACLSLAFAATLLALPALAANSPSAARTASVPADDALPPQVLGLIASAEPIPLTCTDGACTALVSSFCLQEDRPPPSAGQRYDTAGAGDVTLVVRRTDGTETEFSAAGLLGYVSEGDFTRTRVELPAKRLASLGAAEVAVRIAPLVSLMPRTEIAPSAAVAARDAETAEGAPRFAAEAFFKPGSPRADAAVTLSRLINLLPATGPVRTESAGAISAAAAKAWGQVQASGALRSVSQEGVERARTEVDRCAAYADMGFKITLRGCLAKSHDRTMREVNEELWKSQPGY